MDRATFLKLLGGTALSAPFGGCGKEESPPERGKLKLDWGKIKCPFLDRAPEVASRDPALIYHNGVFRCFFTAVEKGRHLYLGLTQSRDLIAWSVPVRLTASELNFSSPGNIIWAGGRWVLCVQSYPILPGERYGSEASRLWLMESPDLVNWRNPRPIKPEGCQGTWTHSHRQIDPYLVMHNGMYWCFYKTSGCLGILVSDDLRTWNEAVPDHPVVGRDQTPDGATVENPCVVWDRGEFILFFARVGEGRGIGVARSRNLIDWRDIHYLDFPDLSWAPGGATAAMVLDLRNLCGKWLMAFHGERHNSPAALGLAWSDDLENWKIRD
jgi:hypothetical protein